MLKIACFGPVLLPLWHLAICHISIPHDGQPCNDRCSSLLKPMPSPRHRRMNAFQYPIDRVLVHALARGPSCIVHLTFRKDAHHFVNVSHVEYCLSPSVTFFARPSFRFYSQPQLLSYLISYSHSDIYHHTLSQQHAALQHPISTIQN